MTMETPMIKPTEFNGIGGLDHDTPAFTHEKLLTLGQLFVQHEVHEILAIGQLHRHIELRPDCIMVHERQPSGIDICRMKSLDSLTDWQIKPHSLFLDDCRKFQAYEYEYGDEVQSTRIPDELVSPLRTMLIALDLQSSVAIVPASKSSGQSHFQESLIEDDNGTVIGMKKSPAFGERHDTTAVDVVTSWTIDVHDSQIMIKEATKCRMQVTGVHIVSKDEC